MRKPYAWLRRPWYWIGIAISALSLYGAVMSIFQGMWLCLAIMFIGWLVGVVMSFWDDFSLGTKSVLFGAHAFWLHPWFVALAWYKLHGFRRVTDEYVTTSLLDPRLWASFFLHDIGYVGKPNMDGAEGEQHPIVGACIVSRLFDDRAWGRPWWHPTVALTKICDAVWGKPRPPIGWFRFVRNHSRYLAKQDDSHVSALCIADKYAGLLEPRWLYLPRVKATGEVYEYVNNSWRKREPDGFVPYPAEQITNNDINNWYIGYHDYMVRWIAEHRDGKPDEWTEARNHGRPA